MAKTQVGIIGCGNICGIYLKNMSQVLENLEVKACADVMKERAVSAASKFPCVQPMTVKALLSDLRSRLW